MTHEEEETLLVFCQLSQIVTCDCLFEQPQCASDVCSRSATCESDSAYCTGKLRRVNMLKHARGHGSAASASAAAMLNEPFLSIEVLLVHIAGGLETVIDMYMAPLTSNMYQY